MKKKNNIYYNFNMDIKKCGYINPKNVLYMILLYNKQHGFNKIILECIKVNIPINNYMSMIFMILFLTNKYYKNDLYKFFLL